MVAIGRDATLGKTLFSDLELRRPLGRRLKSPRSDSDQLALRHIIELGPHIPETLCSQILRYRSLWASFGYQPFNVDVAQLCQRDRIFERWVSTGLVPERHRTLRNLQALGDENLRIRQAGFM